MKVMVKSLISKNQFCSKEQKNKKTTSNESTQTTKQNIVKDLRQTGQTIGIIQNHQPSINDFIIIRPIGKGHTSQVYLALHKQTNFLFSMKIISKEQLQGNMQLIQQLIDQIKIQLFSKNPNIIQLYSFFMDQKNVYMCLQLGTDGQLYSKMSIKTFSQEATSIIIRQILNGMTFLHQNGIIHHDLKPENIILVHGTAKICDFGCSTVLKKQKKRLGGTPLYWAPQILKNKAYGPEVDVWALGILTYQLLSGDNPFKIRKEQDLFKIIQQNFRMKVGSIQLLTFINLILKSDVKKRPNSKQLLNHPFITKFIQLDHSIELIQFKS